MCKKCLDSFLYYTGWNRLIYLHIFRLMEIIQWKRSDAFICNNTPDSLGHHELLLALLCVVTLLSLSVKLRLPEWLQDLLAAEWRLTFIPVSIIYIFAFIHYRLQPSVSCKLLVYISYVNTLVIEIVYAICSDIKFCINAFKLSHKILHKWFQTILMLSLLNRLLFSRID